MTAALDLCPGVWMRTQEMFEPFPENIPELSCKEREERERERERERRER